MIRQLLHKYREAKRLFGAEVFIYSMGKVGSNSLSYTLESAGIDCSSKHYFGGEQLHFFQNHKSNWPGKAYRKWAQFYLRQQPKKVNIITLVRDPLARNLSMTFFSLERILYHTLQSKDGRNLKGQNLSRSELIQIGFEEQLNHRGPLLWFEEEFGAVVGINVYDFPFDQSAGYSIIEQEHVRVLILKLEKLQSLEKVIAKFVGLKDFKLRSANRSEKNWYADLYKEFKQNFVPTEEYIQLLYESKFMKHFYSKEEIEQLRKRWTGATKN